jgi:hypothetical protein
MSVAEKKLGLLSFPLRGKGHCSPKKQIKLTLTGTTFTRMAVASHEDYQVLLSIPSYFSNCSTCAVSY